MQENKGKYTSRMDPMGYSKRSNHMFVDLKSISKNNENDKIKCVHGAFDEHDVNKPPLTRQIWIGL